ncbi:hypothetical protein P865_00925 [Brucella abortus 82]|nr:hypothetical protein M798_02570 [Brucella melitensis ADMAS-G1]ERM03998.1 hypothetical protein P408_15080 [Brucella abortus S99]ERM87877.1 hypothetical protein P865_00925 [Brucella abortus 82]EXU83927.1 hypothetical protein AX23_02635 [Brucella melitensis 548]
MNSGQRLVKSVRIKFTKYNLWLLLLTRKPPIVLNWGLPVGFAPMGVDFKLIRQFKIGG